MNLRVLEHLRHCVKAPCPFSGDGSQMGGVATISQMGSNVLPGTFPTPDKTFAPDQVFSALGLDRPQKKSVFVAARSILTMMYPPCLVANNPVMPIISSF